jgi:hypothetical protein
LGGADQEACQAIKGIADFACTPSCPADFPEQSPEQSPDQGVDPAVLPQSMEVDYVRVYRMKGK